MKKLLFVLLMLVSTVTAQVRLEYTKTEIINEFSGEEYNLVSGYDTDGDFYIRIFTARTVTLFYFDEEGKCNTVVIFPDDRGALNWYVEHYNNHYVIVSETEWRAYFLTGIATVKLYFKEHPFFVWK